MPAAARAAIAIMGSVGRIIVDRAVAQVICTAASSTRASTRPLDRITRAFPQRLRHVREPDDDYVVMTDPEGNEFCVAAKENL